MRKRTLAREFALKILYQKDIKKIDMDMVTQSFWEAEKEQTQEVKDFAQRLVFGIQQNRDKIDDKISSYATNWQLKRMAVIDRNILRMGVFELFYAPDIPPKVTINEAVELAKKYGDLESSKFVNGVLDKMHKTEIAQDK